MNWHFMRWLRLALGIFVGFQAIQLRDPLAGMVAAFFLFQVVTNTGCCGADGCAVPRSQKNDNEKETVEYEEIKSDQK